MCTCVLTFSRYSLEYCIQYIEEKGRIIFYLLENYKTNTNITEQHFHTLHNIYSSKIEHILTKSVLKTIIYFLVYFYSILYSDVDFNALVIYYFSIK